MVHFRQAACVGAAIFALTLSAHALAQTATIDWNKEDSYWSNNYTTRPYYKKTVDYGNYQPAYQYGVDLYSRSNGRPYSDLSDSDLRAGWKQVHGNSTLGWDDVREATRDAYNRMYDGRAVNNVISGASSVNGSVNGYPNGTGVNATTIYGSAGSVNGNVNGSPNASIAGSSPSR